MKSATGSIDDVRVRERNNRRVKSSNCLSRKPVNSVRRRSLFIFVGIEFIGNSLHIGYTHTLSRFISPIVLRIGKSNAPYDTRYYRYVTGTLDGYNNNNNNNIMMIEHTHTHTHTRTI